MTETRYISRLRVDTHVHVHACFDCDRFLDAAAVNLGVKPSIGDQLFGVLCLTETAEADWFQQVKTALAHGGEQGSRWRFEATAEKNSTLAADADDRQIAIVAGRQIVTAEGLEVLALGLAERFDDGQAIGVVLEQVSRAGALPVLPWGFGKWTGRRGRIVRQIIADPPCAIFLGDNGGRLSMISEPPEFAEGRDRGMSILPGTDPFPFPWDVSRVGSYGLEWDSSLDSERPFQSLRALLADPHQVPRPYGQLERLPAFLRNQVAIQGRKWSRKLRR